MAKRNRIQNRQAKPMKVGFHRKKKTNQGKFMVNDEYTIKQERQVSELDLFINYLKYKKNLIW